MSRSGNNLGEQSKADAKTHTSLNKKYLPSGPLNMGTSIVDSRTRHSLSSKITVCLAERALCVLFLGFQGQVKMFSS